MPDPAGPAARREIVPGMKLIEVNGQAVETPEDVRRILADVDDATLDVLLRDRRKPDKDVSDTWAEADPCGVESKVPVRRIIGTSIRLCTPQTPVAPVAPRPASRNRLRTT